MAKTSTQQRTGLPRIIRFNGRSDSGEYGNASCPHCGADGRYVFHFLCEDGTSRGAMAGCIKLFPVAPVAKAHAALIEKGQDYAKKEWNLPSWDLAKLEAIESFYRSEIDERTCELRIANQTARAAAYRANRKGRR